VPADVPKKIAEADASAVQKSRKKKRTGRTVVIVLLLLVLLSAGAGVALNWDWVTQFFASPAVAQPYQTYQNSSLGVSLAYTQGWSVSVDQAHSVVQFADGTHTGQARLSVTAASGQVNAYLTQQVTQQGITGAKTASAATIAGASWQVVQGTVAQSGATYTVVLYATQRNSRFYLLEFLAPQPAFTSIDQSSFAHMRSTFNFT
jgi:hypothetical protein